MNFTSVKSVHNLKEWIEQANTFKDAPFNKFKIGKHKTLGLIFFNSSLRTRLSTTKAAQNLGMHVIQMNIDKEGWQLELEDGAIMNGNAQEHIKEAAAVISLYCDIIAVRSFPSLLSYEFDKKDTVLNAFLKNARVPVISLESSLYHPLQSFADVLTIENFKKFERPKVVLTWVPHPRALPHSVPNSFVEWSLAMNYNLVVAAPENMELDDNITGNVTYCHHQNVALKGADFVYAKNWSCFKNYGKIHQDSDWKITKQKMLLTNDAYFMHCLPVRRNVVVADEVLDEGRNLTLVQAENRIYTAQTVLYNCLLSTNRITNRIK